MRIGTPVGHGIDSEGDVEPLFIRLARGCFDTAAGSHTHDHDLGHVSGSVRFLGPVSWRSRLLSSSEVDGKESRKSTKSRAAKLNATEPRTNQALNQFAENTVSCAVLIKLRRPSLDESFEEFDGRCDLCLFRRRKMGLNGTK